jgi:hypothetical protein
VGWLIDRSISVIKKKTVLKLMDRTVYFPLLFHGMHSFPHLFFSALQHALIPLLPIETLRHTLLPRFRRLLRKAKSDYLLRATPPFVRLEQLGSHWTDFNEIPYLSIFF